MSLMAVIPPYELIFRISVLLIVILLIFLLLINLFEYINRYFINFKLYCYYYITNYYHRQCDFIQDLLKGVRAFSAMQLCHSL